MARTLANWPYLEYSADDLRDEFEERRESLSRDNCLAIIRIWIEILLFRDRFRMNGTTFTRVGKLFEEVDYFIAQRRKEIFRWPSTDAEKGDGSFDTDSFADETPLFRCGYSVRKGGPMANERQQVLRQFFASHMRLAEEEVETWGGPESSIRLRKMAECIAAFARNAKRRAHPPQQAIAKWEADLSWLKDTFYYPRGFGFPWPKAGEGL